MGAAGRMAWQHREDEDTNCTTEYLSSHSRKVCAGEREANTYWSTCCSRALLKVVVSMAKAKVGWRKYIYYIYSIYLYVAITVCIFVGLVRFSIPLEFLVFFPFPQSHIRRDWRHRLCHTFDDVFTNFGGSDRARSRMSLRKSADSVDFCNICRCISCNTIE